MAGHLRFNKPNPIALPAAEFDSLLDNLRGRSAGAGPQPAVRANPGASAPPATSTVARPGGWRFVFSGDDANCLPLRELSLITTQLTILSRLGLDLAQSLQALSKRVTHPQARAAVARLHGDIESGLSFSESLRRQEGVFGATFVATVAAGEASGRLTSVLERLNTLFRNDLRLRTAVRSVLTYPIILVFVALVVLAAMLFFVLPQFSRVFASMNRPAPLVTQWLLDAGELARGYWWALLPAGLLTLLGVWRMVQSAAFRSRRDRWLLTGRWSAPVVRHLLTGRVFRLLATILQSGVPLLDAIQLSRRTVSNQNFQALLRSLEDEIMAGRPLSPGLERSICLPDGTSDLVSTAESAGELGSVLELVGQFYEEEGEQRLKGLVRVLEPVIIITMGIFVASIVLAIMLPLLDLSTSGH
ncbi:MAG: type II secretion system F family protein [Planctomycetaceae bacterium]